MPESILDHYSDEMAAKVGSNHLLKVYSGKLHMAEFCQHHRYRHCPKLVVGRSDAQWARQDRCGKNEISMT